VPLVQTAGIPSHGIQLVTTPKTHPGRRAEAEGTMLMTGERRVRMTNSVVVVAQEVKVLMVSTYFLYNAFLTSLSGKASANLEADPNAKRTTGHHLLKNAGALQVEDGMLRVTTARTGKSGTTGPPLKTTVISYFKRKNLLGWVITFRRLGAVVSLG
jgi:hypothetical protein